MCVLPFFCVLPFSSFPPFLVLSICLFSVGLLFRSFFFSNDVFVVNFSLPFPNFSHIWFANGLCLGGEGGWRLEKGGQFCLCIF